MECNKIGYTRVAENDYYYYITAYGNVFRMIDMRGNASTYDFENGNYYPTVEAAMEAAIIKANGMYTPVVSFTYKKAITV